MYEEAFKRDETNTKDMISTLAAIYLAIAIGIIVYTYKEINK